MIRGEIGVCVDHYWEIQHRLDRLGMAIKDFQGPITDLLKSEELWKPVAQALADEASLLRQQAGRLREAARDAVTESRAKRKPASG